LVFLRFTDCLCKKKKKRKAPVYGVPFDNPTTLSNIGG